MIKRLKLFGVSGV